MLHRNPLNKQPDARPPEDVRFTELRVEPWLDGKKVRVHVSLTPFQQNPNLDALITDSANREAAHASIIEIADPRFVFTLHIRTHPVGGVYTLTANLSYQDLGTIEERTLFFELSETGNESNVG
jgi:hypothetical protein